MQYGLYEIKRNIISLIRTKIFYPKARLIRYPVFIRNKKNIQLGKGFTCGYNCRIEAIVNSEKSGKITFGEDVKIGDYVHIAAAEEVSIGNQVLMASHVFITDLDHGSYTKKGSNPNSNPDNRPLYTKPTVIDDKVWIGENAVILKGVYIGEGSVIGANALVNTSIPAYSVVVGQPAKVIKTYDFEKQEWVSVK